MNKKLALVSVAMSMVLAACSTFNDKKENVPRTGTEDDGPSLTKPKVRSFVVPDTIEGNKYIKSHRVYILEDPGSWSK